VADIGDLIPRPTSVTSGFGMVPTGWRGGPRSFVPRSDRWIGMSVEIDLLGLPTLPERMIAVLHERLVVNMRTAADKVLETASRSLYKPVDFPVHRHGEDTGKLKRSLVAKLVEHVNVSVAYDLESDDAPYWIFVEFGRIRADGSWWPGYHFLTGAIMQHEGTIRTACRVSMHETFTILASENRSPGGAGMPLPTSAETLQPQAMTEQGDSPVPLT
jgi:hypothetical protein